jgi:hypothetical protein
MDASQFHAPKFFRKLGTTVVQRSAAERQESHMTRLFDSRRHHTLVFGACASLAAWTDFSFFGYIFAEQVGLFIINDQQLIRAKLAKLGLGEKSAVTAAFTAAARITAFFTHDLLQKN